jgi:hypothetical protein
MWTAGKEQKVLCIVSVWDGTFEKIIIKNCSGGIKNGFLSKIGN